MRPIDEERLERYVRDPDALTTSERQSVEDLVDSDRGAAEFVRALRSFYDEFGQSDSPDPAALDAFVEKIAPLPAVIPLRDIRKSPDVEKLRQLPRVLAAATKGSDVPVSTVASLGSEEENCVVRIILDRQSKRCHLYVVTSDARVREDVLLSLPAIGRELKVDHEGRATFPAPSAKIDWKNVASGATLHVPIDRLHIGPDDGAVEIARGIRLRWHRRGSLLDLAFQANEPAQESEVYSASTLVVEFDNHHELVTLQSDEIKRSIPATTATVFVYG